jgi:hypothetical protein
MSTLQGENWQEFLNNLQTNKIVNDHMAEIQGLVRFNRDPDQCLEQISKNPGLSMLLVDGFSELVLLQNLESLPVNVFRIDPKLIALSREGKIANCYRIDPVSAFTDLEFPAPAWRDLKNVTTPDAITNLLPQDPVTNHYKGKQVMVVPPLVSTTILEAHSLLPEVLIPILSAKFQEFDRASTTVKACTVLRPVLEFLWAVLHKKIPSIILGLDNGQEARDWSAKLHTSCIAPSALLPPPFMPPPPLGSNPPQDQSSLTFIAGDLRLLRDATERQHLREITNKEEKKNSSNNWEKLPEEVQTMILHLSATSKELLPTGPADSYLKVLKQTKAIGVATVLNLGLSMKGCQVEVPMTMANAVKTGNFRANSQLVAHAFSIFNLPYMEAANMSNYNKIELEILLTKGDSIPKEVAKKLTENKAKCPDNTHHLRHQLNNWYGMLQICFGKEALIMKEARAWIDHVDKFELSYDAQFKTDTEFGVKVLGLIDLTFFQFCDSCLKADSLEEVDFGSIALDNDHYNITRNTFQACVPAYLAIQQKRRADNDPEDSEDETKKRRRKLLKEKEERDKFQIKDLGNLVKNPNPVAEWKVEGKKYKKTFTKDVMTNTPAFNETGLVTCNKWHVQDYCFEKCERKATHKPFVSATHRSAYDKWVKEQKAKNP